MRLIKKKMKLVYLSFHMKLNFDNVETSYDFDTSKDEYCKHYLNIFSRRVDE